MQQSLWTPNVGASVALADWNEGAVDAAVEKLTTQDHKAIAIRCDVADDTQVDRSSRCH